MEYGSILVERNKRVKQDLVLSPDLASLYAMTHDKVGLGAGPRGPGVGVEPSGAGGVGGRCWRRLCPGSAVLLLLCPWFCLRPALRGGLGRCPERASPTGGRRREALGSLCELRQRGHRPAPPPCSIGVWCKGPASQLREHLGQPAASPREGVRGPGPAQGGAPQDAVVPWDRTPSGPGQGRPLGHWPGPHGAWHTVTSRSPCWRALSWCVRR